MNKTLIASYDMEVGGVERSLITLLEQFAGDEVPVDLFLYRHVGEFMQYLPEEVTLLPEVPAYSTFRYPIADVLRQGHYTIGAVRLFSRYKALWLGHRRRLFEPGYMQLQYMWKYALRYLPELETEYDTAISYLWPHYFVAEKVQAKQKIAWIHTDFSTVEADPKMDETIWNAYDHIVAVSEACRDAFVTKYPRLAEKTIVIENLQSPAFIRREAEACGAPEMEDDPRIKLVTVARLSYAKGIDIAVDAMKKLKEKGITGIAWYVVGYGGDEAMLRQRIADHGLEDCMYLLGKKVNPYPYIEAADVYVQPSRYEGKAVTVSEAQILGKPVLITDYPTASSQMEDGVDGMICALSADGIAAAVRRLAHHHELRGRLAAACRARSYGNEQEKDKIYALLGGNVHDTPEAAIPY
ncbi:glycosyltransferase [Alkalicoccus chagannorensis]|uniref:glycosyltransferase n=1 Tax=Alkalicoccus chagannorensis TaxID=427072 RepID=UPI00040F7A91|nr:glycosyltransferase [Alkalicoccus chagannorensis]